MSYFVSYGDKYFYKSRKRIADEAWQMGFDQVRVYEPKDLPADFIQLTRPWIFNLEGAGFWLWKPWVVKQTFARMRDGDICLYADAGCQLNPSAKKRFGDYIRILDEHGGALAFRLVGFSEEKYTTEAVFDFFGIAKGDPVRTSDQVMATFFLLRKNDNTAGLVNEFFQAAVQRPDLFSDDYNRTGNSPNFIAHRHDQSFFSLFYKRAGFVSIPDESWAKDWSRLQDVPILSRRLRQRTIRRAIRKRFNRIIDKVRLTRDRN